MAFFELKLWLTPKPNFSIFTFYCIDFCLLLIANFMQLNIVFYVKNAKIISYECE